MGNDFHITRADNWFENKKSKIGAKEWMLLVEGDSELDSLPENGKYYVCWTNATDPHGTWFDWNAGNVYTTAPNREALLKMIAMARLLKAQVQADDGSVCMSIKDYDQVAGQLKA